MHGRRPPLDGRGRGRGPHRPRDRARPAARRRRRARDDRRALGDVIARGRRRPTSGCARRTCRRSVAPGIVELLATLGVAAATSSGSRSSPATSSRSRGSSSTRAGIGGYFPRGPGRLRLRRRGPRRSCRRSRARAPRDPPWPRERTVVIGDTPRDIACARADGVRVVAVGDRAVRGRGAGGRGRRRRRRPRPAAGARGLGSAAGVTTSPLPPPRRFGSATAFSVPAHGTRSRSARRSHPRAGAAVALAAVLSEAPRPRAS